MNFSVKWWFLVFIWWLYGDRFVEYIYLMKRFLVEKCIFWVLKFKFDVIVIIIKVLYEVVYNFNGIWLWLIFLNMMIVGFEIMIFNIYVIIVRR